jgi:glutamate N-acetyltransferase / amino-acid N-acetyltransferase
VLSGLWTHRSLGGEPIFAGGTFDLDPVKEATLSQHMREALLTDSAGEELSYPPHERCVEIEVDLGLGDAECTVIGSDLTSEYVHINADYRS